jgi:hypothetical protein
MIFWTGFVLRLYVFRIVDRETAIIPLPSRQQALILFLESFATQKPKRHFAQKNEMAGKEKDKEARIIFWLWFLKYSKPKRKYFFPKQICTPS